MKTKIYSNCCKAEIKIEDSDICPACGEHSETVIICPECSGDRYVDYLDRSRIHPLTINPPLKTELCNMCDGEGYVRIKV